MKILWPFFAILNKYSADTFTGDFHSIFMDNFASAFHLQKTIYTLPLGNQFFFFPNGIFNVYEGSYDIMYIKEGSGHGGSTYLFCNSFFAVLPN